MQLEPLLYPVFDALRKQGVPLGVSEYLEGVDTIARYVFVLDKLQPDSITPAISAQLKRLCALLWAKSKEDQELLDVAFSTYIEPHFETLTQEPEPEPAKPADLPDETPDRPIQQDRPFSSEFSPEFEAVPVQQTQKATTQQIKSGTGQYSPYHTEHYHLLPRLPLSKRDMAGAWRQFRRFRRSGAAVDLDVDATIADIARSGFFLRPVLQARRRNQAGLLLLIDRQGSMSAFAPFINELEQSILRGGLLGRVQRFYFHDYPGKVLFTQANLTRPLSVQDALHHAANNSVLIISDAGAARGDFDSERLDNTRTFLSLLDSVTYLYAWLNPVPRERWHYTTAEEIARHVPMFALNRDGLTDVVNVLRGLPI